MVWFVPPEPALPSTIDASLPSAETLRISTWWMESYASTTMSRRDERQPVGRHHAGPASVQVGTVGNSARRLREDPVDACSSAGPDVGAENSAPLEIGRHRIWRGRWPAAALGQGHAPARLHTRVRPVCALQLGR